MKLEPANNVAITTDTLNRYRRDGYVVADTRLPATTLAAMRLAYQDLINTHPTLNLDFIPSPHIPNYVPGLDNCQPWLDFAATPEILDAVEAIIGADFLMWGSAIFGKPGSGGKATPMHQDGEYWPIRPLASVTVWIALEDSIAENGCLRVVPGSHENKDLFQHRRDDDTEYTLNQVINDAGVNPHNAVDVPLTAGQFSIHDVYLVHGSNPNTSANRRPGLTYRYMPTTSHFDHQWAADMTREKGTTDMSERTLYLMRGIDRCGKNDLQAGASTRLPLPTPDD